MLLIPQSWKWNREIQHGRSLPKKVSLKSPFPQSTHFYLGADEILFYSQLLCKSLGWEKSHPEMYQAFEELVTTDWKLVYQGSGG